MELCPFIQAVDLSHWLHVFRLYVEADASFIPFHCREEENAAIKAKGHTRPLILRNYAATLLSPSISVRKARTGEPQVRQPTGPKSDEMKFYFAFPDGGSLILYPSIESKGEGGLAESSQHLPAKCKGRLW